jgi:hypothetical protein
MPRFGPGRWGGGRYLNSANEAIPSASQCLNEEGPFRRFTQRVAQPLDGGIETVIEVNESVRRPQAIAKLFPRNQLSWML